MIIDIGGVRDDERMWWRWKIISKGGGCWGWLQKIWNLSIYRVLVGERQIHEFIHLSSSHSLHSCSNSVTAQLKLKTLLPLPSLRQTRLCGGWQNLQHEKKQANLSSTTLVCRETLTNSLMALWNHKLQVIDYFFHNSFLPPLANRCWCCWLPCLLPLHSFLFWSAPFKALYRQQNSIRTN